MNETLPMRAGVFENEPAADRAVVDLLAAGFSKDKISVVSSRPIAHQLQHPDITAVTPSGSHTRMSALLGGAIGSLLGVLAAFWGGSGTGWTWLMIAGVLVAATAIGMLVGGFIGAMMSRGFEPGIADFHDQAMKPEQYLVAVEVDSVEARLESAEAAIEGAGAAPMPLSKG
jgi:hypothetical protein